MYWGPGMKRLLLCLIVFPPAIARAQDSTRHALPTVTVTATRQPVAAHLSPFRSQVVSAALIRDMGAETVADVLAACSEFYIRRYSGGLATLSQRGQATSSTLILLDGHRIASPSLGQLDLSLLPSLFLTSVEITAGPGSSAYGRDAVGGVVHLRSRINEGGHARSPLRLEMSGGSYGKRVMSLAASHRRGRVVGTLAGEYDASTGDFPYRNKALFPPREAPRHIRITEPCAGKRTVEPGSFVQRFRARPSRDSFHAAKSGATMGRVHADLDAWIAKLFVGHAADERTGPGGRAAQSKRPDKD